MDNTHTDTAAFPDAIQDETVPLTAARSDTWEEPIEVTITAEERLEKLNRLATVDAEIIRLEEEKKAAAKVFTNQLKPLEAERESILGVLDSGIEKRMTEVYELEVEQLGKIEIRRVDNDELVEERAMTAEEREASAQGDLFGSHGSSNPPPAAEDDDSDDADDFEPTTEALAQAAVDEQRVIKTNSKEAKAKAKKRKANGAASKGSDAE